MTAIQFDLDKNASAGEAEFSRKLIRACLDAGYTVSVCDGEEWTVRQSVDFDTIIGAMATTGEDYIRIRNAEGVRFGTFTLVYQNGEGDEVISDYTDNEVCDAIWNSIMPK